MGVKKKRIVSTKIIKNPTNPDIDSDFHTKYREKAVEYVAGLYGEKNISNIVTFGTLAAKGAFKAMCTIYKVPFVQANKISSLIPPPINGKDCSLHDIYDPESDRYDEAADFRNATSGDEWKNIIEGAIKIAGRNKSTGVHACGIIISSEPLDENIPLQVRQNDGSIVTQWTYPELESLGLIKMDFLGLDTVDIIQKTVEYIMKMGKNPPNMTELVQGPMDDKKTFELFQKANTIGIFQFSSDMVRKLLLQMKPTHFDDLAACTAVARPGPMGMQSHIKYADRKNGREKIDYIHPDFDNSPLTEILGETYGLCIYQEEVMRLSNQIAGLTLKEADELRSAMGKKKQYVMDAMKPKFFEGSLKNGYSEEAITVLWNTISEFAKYAFNKSHSVAYAMNAYQVAYLKANYPTEFMSALIAQGIKDKKKTLSFLREANSMGLKTGTVDINLSNVEVAPDFNRTSNYDILFGISGIKDVSSQMAQIIVDEREKNGKYSSVQDVINRCSPLGVNNKKIYESLALSGAFDNFGVSRKKIIENIPDMIKDTKIKKQRGESLFDMFNDVEDDDNLNIDLQGDEYSYLEKLQKEADVIGLYLTGHPLDKLGTKISPIQSNNIKKIMSTKHKETKTILASVMEITKKSGRHGKTMILDIDDGTEYMSARLSKNMIGNIDKKNAQNTLLKMYLRGDKTVPDNIKKLIQNSDYYAMDDIEKNSVYIMNITYYPGNDTVPYSAQINWLKPLLLSHEGKLPVRIRFKRNSKNNKKIDTLMKALPRSLNNKLPGEYPIIITEYNSLTFKPTKINRYYEEMIHHIENNPSDERDWDKIVNIVDRRDHDDDIITTIVSDEILFNAIDNLDYHETEYMTAKNQKVEQAIEKYLGMEAFDFGLYDPSIIRTMN